MTNLVQNNVQFSKLINIMDKFALFIIEPTSFFKQCKNEDFFLVKIVLQNPVVYDLLVGQCSCKLVVYVGIHNWAKMVIPWIPEQVNDEHLKHMYINI